MSDTVPEWLYWIQVGGAFLSLLLLAFLFGQGCAPKECPPLDGNSVPAGTYTCIDGDWTLTGASR